jgi:hypothetical protein
MVPLTCMVIGLYAAPALIWTSTRKRAGESTGICVGTRTQAGQKTHGRAMQVV